jgi:hypothetical protein
MNIEELEDKLDAFRNVQYRMDNEGLRYCFQSYSSFEDVKDEEFHRLRLNFLSILDELEKYVETKIEDLEDEVNNHYLNED